MAEKLLLSMVQDGKSDRVMQDAVTFGRYNTTTIAHIHTIQRIATHFDQVSIGVIDSSLAIRSEGEPEEFVEFYDLADQQHKKTTLSINERKRLLELSIADKRLGTVAVETIARPEYATAEFNDKYPPENFQMVFPAPASGQMVEFDNVRDNLLPRILGRTAYFMAVDLTIHTTDIKAAVTGCPERWSEYMTPTAYEYFRDIDGPARVGI